MTNSIITEEYIEDHLNNVHTYDSFGRSIVQLALESAKKQLANKTLKGDNVTFEATIKITPVTPKGCIKVEICIPFIGCTYIHQNTPF